eukprot:gene7728-9504_t
MNYKFISSILLLLTITTIAIAQAPGGAIIDWRAKDCVGAVQNEGEGLTAGSIAIVGAIQSQLAIQQNLRVNLSAAELSQCVSSDSISDYYQYVIKNGIELESQYHGNHKPGNCKASGTPYTHIASYQTITQGSESSLQTAVQNVGPVVAEVDATQEFIEYTGGILDDSSCSSTSVNHVVLVVGFGTDPSTNQDYWIIQNSWGENWGVNGYIYLARNKNNQCGIASYSTYPVLH